MATRMLQRRGTAAEWAASNPVLGDGEVGYARDTRTLKIGDGVTAWNALGVVLPNSYIAFTLADNKGDLIVATGNDTFAKFPVGADASVLTADSSQPGGIKWQQPAANVSIVSWTADTIYATGTNVVNPSGELVKRTAASGSEAAYDSSKWSTPASALYVPFTGGTITGNLTLGDADNDFFYRRSMVVQTDTRNVTVNYTTGKVSSIVEKMGATTVRTTTFTYTGNNLTTIAEVAGGKTVTTTLAYDGSGNLTGTTKTVA